MIKRGEIRRSLAFGSYTGKLHFNATLLQLKCNENHVRNWILTWHYKTFVLLQVNGNWIFGGIIPFPDSFFVEERWERVKNVRQAVA